MFILADRVKENTITTGTGSVALNAGFGAYQTFASGIGDGNQTYYAIENDVRWEVGVGTYAVATNTLTRDTVLSSSNSDTLISLDGVSTVFATYPADRAVAFGFTNYLPDGYPLTLARTGAGNFFHAYVDNADDETVALHMTNESTPTWTLGLKGSPSSKTSKPTYGYTYGTTGRVGLHGHTDAYLYIDSDLGFVVSHESVDMFKTTKDAGSIFTNGSSNVTGLTVKGAVSQSYPLQIWTNSADSTLSSVGANGYFAINQSSASYPLDVNGTANMTTLRFDDGTSQITASRSAADFVALSGDVSTLTSSVALKAPIADPTFTGTPAAPTAAESTNTTQLATTAFVTTAISSITVGSRAYRTIGVNTTLLSTDAVIFVHTLDNSVTVSLPTAVGNGGKEFFIKRLHDINSVTVSPNGSEKIDGAGSFSLYGRNEAISVVSDNSNWYVF